MYHGGPEAGDAPGFVVHGNGEMLEGAKEIAPGTGIYTGGIKAACASVRRSGERKKREALFQLPGMYEKVLRAAKATGMRPPAEGLPETDVLDYRLFVGRRQWGPGELEKEVARGLWQPAACARPVALKQCLALPKPLWHEVMELVGGDCAEFSKFEFMRRDDLVEEEEEQLREQEQAESRVKEE